MNLLNLLIRYSLRISAILFFPFLAKSQSCLNNNARCYIPNSGSNNVSVVDVASQSVISTIPVGNAPRCVAIIGRLHRAYITNVSGASVSVINITNNTVIATIPVGAGASGAVASPDGNTVYISNGSAGTVSVINTNTNAVTATISVGTSPFYEAISPDGTKLYVSNGVSNTVSVINTSTNSVIHTISGLTSPRNLVTNADGSLLYVTNSAAATVSVINTSTYAITTTLTVGTTPVGIALNKTNTRLAVANVNSNSVSIFSLPSHTLLTTISSGLSAPRGLSFTANDSNLFIVNTTSNLLSTYNMHTNSITSNVSIGSSATSIGNFIYEPLLSTAILPCGGTYVWNGNTYTTTGLKSFTTTGSYGCDSTSLLQLNADTSGYATHTITATGCDLYGFNNKIYTSSGTYYDTIHTSACDTAFTLNLTIHQSTKTRYAFVPNKNSDNVTVLDIVSNTVLQTIAVGSGPEAICFNPDGLKAYVANTTDNTISVINTITRVVEQTISCGGIEPVDLITNALGTELFVVNKQSGTVCVFDLKTYALLKTTPVGTNPSSIAMSKSEESYYVTCEPNLLKRIFINSQIIQSFTVGNAPKGVCVSNDDLTVYVANSGSNTVTKFNNGTFGLSLAATVTVGANPTRLVYLANDKVYVTCKGANQVYNAFAIPPTAINVGVQPSGITWSYENNVLMVANSGSNTLTYIRPANDSVIGTSAVGNTPIANGTMLQPKSGTRINLCDAPGYTWANGTTYTSNGVYSHSFTNSAGCDSTSNLYLRLSNTDPIDVISTEPYVCGGGSTSLVVVNNKHCIPFGTNIIPPSVLIGGIIVNSASSQNKIDQVINVSENQYIVIDQKYIPVSASNLYNFHFFKGGGVGNADFEGACFFDFNDDGDFDDVNEYYSIPVVTLPGGGKLFDDINIQIPTTTFNGGIRCRFVVKIINNFYPSGLTQANSCTSGGPVQFMDFFLNVSGGQAASSLLNYTWQPANLIQSTNNTVITTSNLTSTAIYTVTATNSEGCSSSATITIAHQNTGLNVTSTSSHATVCEGAFVQFNSTAPGATSYQYTNGSVALSGQSVSFLTEGFPGINTFTVTASDGNICGTATASVNVYDAFTANATSTSPEICAGNPVQFNTQIQNIAPNTNLTYSWIPTTGLSNPTIANPIFTSTTPGYKEYKVTVSNGNICTLEKKVGITVKPSPTIDSIISSASSICSSTNSISLNAVAHTPPVSYTSPVSNNNSSPYYFGQTAFLNFNSFSSSATYPSGYTLTNTVFTVNANGNYSLTYSPSSGLLYESIPIICTTSVPCNGNGFSQVFTNANGGCEVRTLCGYSDKHYYEGCKVFIDFNIDGDFDDADEQVFSANYSIANFPIAHVVNFTIPNTAKSGITRLRICNGSPYAYSIPKKDKIIDIPIEISGPMISYSWQPSLYLNATNVAQVTASNLPSSMEYYLTATYNGCQQQKSVKINDKSKVTASTLNGVSICSGSTTPVTIVADPPLSTLYCTPTCFTSGNTGNYISNFSLNGPQ
ncbi:MAG: beta-propeller fold lactonase family protein, partial [Chitinophagaceae bacterium]|nr:beta-propeller fold lactonase family protein [Chitinophagaceae bacterium]